MVKKQSGIYVIDKFLNLRQASSLQFHVGMYNCISRPNKNYDSLERSYLQNIEESVNSAGTLTYLDWEYGVKSLKTERYLSISCFFFSSKSFLSGGRASILTLPMNLSWAPILPILTYLKKKKMNFKILSRPRINYKALARTFGHTLCFIERTYYLGRQ